MTGLALALVIALPWQPSILAGPRTIAWSRDGAKLPAVRNGRPCQPSNRCGQGAHLRASQRGEKAVEGHDSLRRKWTLAPRHVGEGRVSRTPMGCGVDRDGNNVLGSPIEKHSQGLSSVRREHSFLALGNGRGGEAGDNDLSRNCLNGRADHRFRREKRSTLRARGTERVPTSRVLLYVAAGQLLKFGGATKGKAGPGQLRGRGPQ